MLKRFFLLMMVGPGTIMQKQKVVERKIWVFSAVILKVGSQFGQLSPFVEIHQTSRKEQHHHPKGNVAHASKVRNTNAKITTRNPVFGRGAIFRLPAFKWEGRGRMRFGHRRRKPGEENSERAC